MASPPSLVPWKTGEVAAVPRCSVGCQTLPLQRDGNALSLNPKTPGSRPRGCTAANLPAQARQSRRLHSQMICTQTNCGDTSIGFAGLQGIQPDDRQIRPSGASIVPRPLLSGRLVGDETVPGVGNVRTESPAVCLAARLVARMWLGPETLSPNATVVSSPRKSEP